MICLLFIFSFLNNLYSEIEYISDFGGINTYYDSGKIAKNDAIDSVNIITDRGFLEKRNGITGFYDTGTSSIIKNIYEYISPNKTKYLIFVSSNSIYYNDFSSQGKVLISTINPDYPINITIAWNKVFFVNRYENSFYWTPTSGKTYISNFPHCRFLEFSDERLYCANNLEYGDSSVLISGYGDYTNWTIPTDRQLIADDPNLLYFDNNDGEGITCFKSTAYGKMVWKKNKTFLLKGVDNDTYYIYPLSNSIGCVSNDSIQEIDGVVIWLGYDGVYGWEGRGMPKLLSKDIYYDIQNNKQRNFEQNNITYRNKEGFDKGIYSDNTGYYPSGYDNGLVPQTYNLIDGTSAFKSSGTLQGLVYNDIVGGLAIPDMNLYDNFDDGDYLYFPTWLPSGINSGCENTFSVLGGKLRFYKVVGCGQIGLTPYLYTQPSNAPAYGRWRLYIDWNNISTSLNFWFVSSSSNSVYTNGYYVNFNKTSNIVTLNRNNINGSSTHLTQAQVPLPSGNYEIERTTYSFKVYSGTNTILSYGAENTYTTGNYMLLAPAIVDNDTYFFVDNVYISTYTNRGHYYSQVYDTGIDEPIGVLANITEEIENGTTIYFYVSDSYDGNNWGSWTQFYKDSQVPINKRYVKFWYILESNAGSGYTPVLSQLQTKVRNTRAEYWSGVEYIPQNINKWLTFYASQESLGGNSIDYYVRGSSIGFTKADSGIIWQSINNNSSLPFTSDTKYIQFRAVFHTNYPDENKINSVTLNYQEGENIPASSIEYEKRYLVCLSSSTYSYNNVCYMLQTNGKWTKVITPLPLISLGLFNNDIIMGDINGKMYKMFVDGVYSDDGTPIEAYWITGDWTLGAPYYNKIFKEFWLDSQVSNSILSIGYSTNKSNTYISKNVSLSSLGNYYLSTRVKNLPDGFANGRYFRFKIYNNENLNFKLNSVIIVYDIDKVLKPY